jgi:hypothetical protein
VEIPLSSLGASNNMSGTDCADGTIELEWVLVGKYDGVTNEGELVEAKMRQKGLFKSMRDYENVQVQLYLHALGYQNGFLVEGFSKAPTKKKKADVKASAETDTKAELVLYTHEVIYDSSYVKEIILARVVAFTKYFAGLMKDNLRKENILRSDRSEWTKYLEEYLEVPQLEF